MQKPIMLTHATSKASEPSRTINATQAFVQSHVKPAPDSEPDPIRRQLNIDVDGRMIEQAHTRAHDSTALHAGHGRHPPPAATARMRVGVGHGPRVLSGPSPTPAPARPPAPPPWRGSRARGVSRD